MAAEWRMKINAVMHRRSMVYAQIRIAHKDYGFGARFNWMASGIVRILAC